MEDGYPCIGLDLMASNLSHDESFKSHTINRFFTKSNNATAHRANGLEEVQQDMKPIVVDTEVNNNNNNNNNNNKNNNKNNNSNNKNDNSNKNKAQKGLFSHVTTSSTSLHEQQEGETYLCDKCNQNILITSVEEHSDYHFAMDLMNKERQQLHQNRSFPSSSSSSSNSTPVKKRKSKQEKLNEDDKKQKKSLFFQPKRTP